MGADDLMTGPASSGPCANRHAGRYGRDWFPRLSGHGAYGQRLNRLADCFPALLERFRETGETASFAGLVDAMPVIPPGRGAAATPKSPPSRPAVVLPDPAPV